MSKLTLPIRAGRSYLMRNGQVTTVQRIDGHLYIDGHPELNDGYIADGRRGSTGPNPLDLAADAVGHVSVAVPASAQIATLMEAHLRKTHADQGGDAEFDDWLKVTLNDESDADHVEAVTLIRARAGAYNS